MAAYFNTTELKTSIQQLVKSFIEECDECNTLNKECLELVRHNFLAEFAVYDKVNKTIEIGIEKTNSKSIYPEIEVYTIPIADAERRILNSFKEDNQDLEFYGQLLYRNDKSFSPQVVVMR